MKVKSLARLSGAVGDREPGEVFDIDQQDAEQLLARGLVEIVKEPAARKPARKKAADNGTKIKGSGEHQATADAAAD